MEKFYESTSVVNVEETHVYYIPFSKGEDPFLPRTKSSRFMSLNGTWKIKEYETVMDAEQGLFAEDPTDDIAVPSCVQMHGYDHMQYVNILYPFPYDPPYAPNLNPTYHYRRSFDYDKKRGERQYLVFEGVDSCFYLYLNGKFVGFSQVSHRLSEFDVTDLLVSGKNVVDVLVLKWCMSSYLEDQDKFRFTGIFRDVYILRRPEAHVVDYHVTTELNGNVHFTLRDGSAAAVELAGERREVKPGETVTFRIAEPRLWSAEDPYLYDMTITCGDEVIGEKVGVRTSAIENGLFKVNGKPVKLLGVNRHDFNCKTGATVTVEDIINDFTLMKKLNVNAIRTSHYPNMPEFYQLADKYGFYIMAESDCESHGVIGRHVMGGPTNYNEIVNDPQFADGMLDRQKRNVFLNFNRPSVVIWSLGNECCYGPNLEQAARWIHSVDSRPVHYEEESALIMKIDRETLLNCSLDMFSRMYPPIEWMKEYIADEREYRPLVLCEYSQATGNGPGDLKAYWDLIYTNDRYMGGFVWEWNDHGIEGKDGNFRYGGDFGETMHDMNWCINGIVTADRKTTAKSFEMKKAYEPVAFVKTGNTLCVTSRKYFTDVVGTLTVTYKENGKVLSGEKHKLRIAPGEGAKFTLKPAQVTIASIVLDEDCGLLEKGHELAREGWTRDMTLATEKTGKSVKTEERGRYIVVTTPSATYTLDKADASIKSIATSRGELLEAPMKLNIWRAPTDNDIYVYQRQWEPCRYYEARGEVRDVTVAANTVRFTGRISTVRLVPAAAFTLTYEFFDNAVSIGIDYNFDEYASYPPRMGFIAKLNSSFKDLGYFGYGPDQAYSDMRFAAIKDYYESTVAEQMVHFLKPQENGSHYGTQFMELTDGKTVLRAEGDFSFSALPYSPWQLAACKHDWELPESDGTYLCLDYFMTGIGSNACGPVLAEEYRTPKKGKGRFTLFVGKSKK